MINGVVISKLQTMEQVLEELRSLGEVTVAGLAGDWKTRRAVERDLQVLTEVVIDVCQRVIALSSQAPAATGQEAVDRCVALGMLSSPDPYRRMIQFRNFIVHRYERVDIEILAEIMRNHLGAYEQFKRETLNYASRKP